MTTWLTGTLPWYVAGPLLGLFVPALLIVGNKQFGVSSNLRHLCSAIAPGKVAFFHYDWRKIGLWNLLFLAGIAIGGFLAYQGGAVHQVALNCWGHDAMVKRIEARGLPYRLNHVTVVDLKQIFVEDPNGVLLELNYPAGQH